MPGSFSRGDLLLLVAVLATFGIVDAAYLTYQWYEAANSSWCDLNSYFSCTRVRDSPFAAIAGIPTAAAGLAGFLLLGVLAVLALRGRNRLGPWPTAHWLLLFAVLGFAVGLALTFLEIFVIQAVCILCVVGFALDIGILVPAWVLVRRPPDGSTVT